MNGPSASRAACIGSIAALAIVLVIVPWVAWLSPSPIRPTDRGVYEATARFGIVRDCSEIHCFRLLVPWTLGSLPGPSLLKSA